MAKSKSSGAKAKAKTRSAGTNTRASGAASTRSYGKPLRTAADVIAETRGSTFSPLFCIYAFAIPFLLTLIAYAGFDVFPFGERSVLTLDLNGQYIYYFESMRDSFWGDSSLFYSWSRNLSGGFMGVVGYYLASPFSLILVLLPRKLILEAVMIMQMCKVGAAGVTFFIYAQKSKNLRPLPSLLFSTMYSMMSFVVIQLMNPMWIDGPIFLPLIVLGIEYLVDDGRKINYIIPLALMFIANFYIGYMIAIFVAIYFVYYLFFGTKRKFKKLEEYGKTIGIMVLSTIVVLMCSIIMILPVYNALALGKFDFSEPDYDWKKRLFQLPELIPTLLPNQYYSVNVDEGTRMYGRPEIYCGVLTVVLLPLFYLNKKIRRNNKIGYSLLVFTMIFSMYIKPINMMWHGGQDPNWLPYRYSFLLSFLLVAMAAEIFSNLDGYKLSVKNVAGTFAGIAALVLYFEAKMPSYNYNEERYKYVATTPYKDTMSYGSDTWEEIWLGTLVFGLILAAVYLTIVYFYSHAKTAKLKSTLLVTMAALVFFEAGYNCYDSFRKIFKEVGNSDRKSYTDIISAPDVVAELEEYDGSFYRAEKTYNRMVNDNLAYGLKGISHSSSVMNTRAINFIDALGYYTQSFESQYKGNNPVADSLMGIKYVLDDDTRTSSSQKMLDSTYEYRYSTDYIRENNQKSTIDVYENPNALAIGYMADDDILNLGNLGNDNPLNSLNNYLSALTGNTASYEMPIIPKQYYVPLQFSLQYDETKVARKDYNYFDEKNNRIIVHDCFDALPDAGDAVVNLRTTMPKDGCIYMHLGSEMRKPANVWVSNTKDADGNFTNHQGYDTTLDPGSTPVKRIGPFTAGEEIEIRLTIQATGENGRYVGSNEYFMVRKENGFNIYYLDEEAFVSDINILKQNQWEIDMEKSNDRYLEGTVTAHEGQIFVTSIPYEPGWTIKVDGKKIDSNIIENENEDGSITLLNDSNGGEGEVLILGTMIGIRLSPGEHTISMKYTPPGFNIGLVTLILGIGVLVMFYIYDRKHNPVLIARRKEKERRKLGLAEEEPADKKKVQIIKSKGAVEAEVSAAAEEKAKKAKEEEEKIKQKTEELISKGKEYAKAADEELSEAEENIAKLIDSPTVLADAEDAAPKADAPKQNNNSKKKKKKK